MEFETKCLETLDKIMSEIEELSNVSPEEDDVEGMIDSRKKWFAIVCDAYITQEVSYNAKELLRIYTGYDDANIVKQNVIGGKMKIAVPMSKRDRVIECCNSALTCDLNEYQKSVVEGIKKIFEVTVSMAFPTAVVYVVDQGEFDLMLKLSKINYSTVGDMIVIDEVEMKNV